MLPHRFNKVLISLGASAILLVICYLFDNAAYPLGDKSGFLTLIETNIQKVRKPGFDKDSVIFINTGYDLDIVETEQGKEIITNRKTLTKLLSDINETDFKYVIMDIRLESAFATSFDSSLVAQIKKMGNKIVVANHWDFVHHRDLLLIDDSDSSLRKRAAYCDYTATIFNTAFEKYQYNQYAGPSAALVAYNDMTGKTIRKHGVGKMGLFFTDGSQICFNSLFIIIPENFSQYRIRKNGTPLYWNLHEDFYGEEAAFNSDDLKGLCQKKIIVIGDFVNDLHSTYMGSQPGPYLHYLALDNLKKGKHRISWWYFVVLFMLFSLIFIEISSQRKLAYMIKPIRESHNKVLHFAISLVSYGSLLTLVSGFTYLVFSRPLGVFVPTLVFTLTDLFFRYQKYEA